MRYSVTAVLLLLSAASASACDLKIEGAWIRTAPPGATVLAGYGKLVNTGTQALRIRGVQSAEFGKIEAHETQSDNGISKMRAIEVLEIPANGAIELQPGGKHLMLMQPKRTLKEGEDATFRFEDANGCVTTAAFKVGNAAAQTSNMDHAQMDHSKMHMDHSSH
jgi:copper(I)-binding protein